MSERILFGGSGRFGSEFIKKYPEYSAPTSHEVDIAKEMVVREYIYDTRPAQVIHAAAVVGLNEANVDLEHTFRVNVNGTKLIAKACQDVGSRMIYIGSVSVFDGKRGMYREDDIPNPSYYYGWTKLLGEQSVEMLSDYTIIRTDFFTPDNFKHKQAFVDHHCSKMPIGELVRAVKEVGDSNYKGILHIGSKRDTLHNILKQYFPNIEGVRIQDSSMPSFPADLSLDISQFQELFMNDEV